MESQQSARRIFSLDEARALLPEVKTLTSGAVRRVEALTAKLRKVKASDPMHAELEESIESAVRAWGLAIQALGIEVKGLWLIDFDNGEGYYCWRHPEDTVSHYHGYDEGFAGRMKIV